MIRLPTPRRPRPTAPPAATDILGGDGDPFDSGSWTLATDGSIAPVISGGVLTFAQENSAATISQVNDRDLPDKRGDVDRNCRHRP